MRTVLLALGLGGLAGLGWLDFFTGDPRRGLAAILLSVANALLLLGD